MDACVLPLQGSGLDGALSTVWAVSSRVSSTDVGCLTDNPGITSPSPFLPGPDTKSLSTFRSPSWASHTRSSFGHRYLPVPGPLELGWSGKERKNLHHPFCQGK